MTDEDEQILIEQVAGAHRIAPQQFGELRYHAAWYDLSPEARDRAFQRARALRTVEAALDPQGLSTTARAVLGRIGGRTP